jgi:hypothetical protein
MKRELVKVAGAFTMVENLHAESDEPLKSNKMSLPPNRSLFKEYPNRIGIETGSWRGDGIQAFLDAGFSEVRSIDIDPENTKFCRHRFDLIPRPEGEPKPVKLWTGDSAIFLLEIIKDIQEPMTLFLDGHWQFFEGEDPGANPFPLLKELEQIGRHPIKSHTIIIDDWHIFYEDRVGYSKQDIKDALLRINPNYRFTMAANPVIDGILICTV